MSSNLPRYTLRIPQSLLDKARYIAAEEGRSLNKEIEIMLKKRIAAYELENGEITPELINRLRNTD